MVVKDREEKVKPIPFTVESIINELEVFENIKKRSGGRESAFMLAQKGKLLHALKLLIGTVH